MQKGGLDTPTPEREGEREHLNVMSWSMVMVRGQPQKLNLQVCCKRLNFNLNT